VIALYVIVPLRHAVLNNNGVATGLMIVAMAAIGITLGFFMNGKVPGVRAYVLFIP
jgi:hypothetical protein